MSIRVNPNILPDLLSGLNQARQQLDQSDLELASGRSINQPSDNPAGTSALILNHAAQSQNDQLPAERQRLAVQAADCRFLFKLGGQRDQSGDFAGHGSGKRTLSSATGRRLRSSFRASSSSW